MILRTFSEADREAVIGLWHEVGLTRPWNDPGADIDRAAGTWPDLFVVAERDAAVVGTAMAGYDGHRGWVYYLAVAPHSQRQGIGRALLAEAEARLTSLGCPKAMLMVRRGNESAHGFYGSLGYSVDEVETFGKRLLAD
ncbi:GNAT family acetyltransferase [Sinomonas cyclohexanicum]|uniref:GNAT family acetyltransferase n=1 Tax=Sinomonas cyclohexanicum TaxID=322009 RepID=A0ABN6FDS3_SINCY|nr:GNAT family acetyltransferase [Corynebacterium cyclohexanicum]BCT74545.1 GNAT family acetyltransferase [Corynebacterium cyclohexanicum]